MLFWLLIGLPLLAIPACMVWLVAVARSDWRGVQATQKERVVRRVVLDTSVVPEQREACVQMLVWLKWQEVSPGVWEKEVDRAPTVW